MEIHTLTSKTKESKSDDIEAKTNRTRRFPIDNTTVISLNSSKIIRVGRYSFGRTSVSFFLPQKGWIMRSASIPQSAKLVLVWMVCLLALWVMAPQHAEAKIEKQRVEAREGDPIDGWEYDGGDLDSDSPPPEDQDEEPPSYLSGINFLDPRFVVHGQTFLFLELKPFFGSQTLIWSVFPHEIPMKGGRI